jgi:hypothetical protein
MAPSDMGLAVMAAVIQGAGLSASRIAPDELPWAPMRALRSIAAMRLSKQAVPGIA